MKNIAGKYIIEKVKFTKLPSMLWIIKIYQIHLSKVYM